MAELDAHAQASAESARIAAAELAHREGTYRVDSPAAYGSRASNAAGWAIPVQ